MASSPALHEDDAVHKNPAAAMIGLEKEVQPHDQSPVEQVAATVSTLDDASLPVWTFRMWSIGLLSCVLLSFLNQFVAFRAEPLIITLVPVQILAVPIGRFMASVLPTRRFALPFGRSFTLNPGPFNVKEHVLIAMFANAGSSFGNGPPYATHIVNIVKTLYHRSFPFVVGWLVVITTQVLGYGWAGLFHKHLVDSPYMWWPGTLPQVTLFRVLHEKESRRGLTRTQFFMICMTTSFAYYLLPGYLFTILTTFSWVCWAFPRSVTLQQIGSGQSGLGLGALSLDWSGISSYLGSPLVTPFFAIVNIGVGFILFMYVILPIGYWNNLYDARKFPIYSFRQFTGEGKLYHVLRLLNDKNEFDDAAFAQQGPLHLSLFFALIYGFSFAAIAATLTHVLCFYGKDIWEHSRNALSSKSDVHNRLMQRYPSIPMWWWMLLLGTTLAVSIIMCEVYKHTIQLPSWGLLVACALSCFFTLPIGIITATTNQTPGLNVITEYIVGYMLQGKPIANVTFKTYGYNSMGQAISFLQDFKLGHYMKIPPRSMFMVQVVGTIVAGTVNMGVVWWLLNTIPNICQQNLLPANSPWQCPNDNVFFSASIIWGLVGPHKVFGSKGVYFGLNWFFLIGLLLPIVVYLFHLAFPKATWIPLINMPVFLGATLAMPPATSVNYMSWIIVGTIFNYFVFKYHKAWWKRHNYVLSAGLDAGLAFMLVALYFCLQINGIAISWWGSDPLLGEHCPLAPCPTTPGIQSDLCPYNT